MTPQELYNSFLLGKDLPSLSLSAARRLLDQARSALLTAGRTLKNAATGTPSQAKQAVLEAHRQLQAAGIASGSEPIYNSANPIETQLCNGISNDRLLDEFERFKRTNPNGSLLQHLTTLHSDPSAPSRAATPSAPARPPVKAPSTTATTRPAPARVQAPAPVRPTAARPAPAATPTPNPLADYSLTKLAWLAGHRSATESDRQTARAELRRRGATLSPGGIVSQSYARPAKK